MNLICLRPDRRPVVGARLVLGVSPNIYKLKATLCGILCLRKVCPGILVWNGMQFPLGTRLGKCVPLFSWIPGCIFRLRLVGKVRPTLGADSGTWFPVGSHWEFPVGAPLGKCVPLRPPRVGCTFRKAPQRETTSHSKGKFRDAFFESLPIRKARPTLDASGHGTIDLSGLPSIKRRPPGRRGTKFIASSARKGGHLMWPSSCAGL